MKIFLEWKVGLDFSICGSTVHASNPASAPFSYDFQTVDVPTEGTASTVVKKIYKFGDGTVESGYNTYYTYTSSTTNTIRYFVFDVEGQDPFNIQLYSASGNNGAKFTTYIRCVMVLEVAEDPNLPKDFYGTDTIDAIDWSNI